MEGKGTSRSIFIHNAGLPMVLMSPKHWNQEAGSGELTTTGRKCNIKWGQHLEYCKTNVNGLHYPKIEDGLRNLASSRIFGIG